MKYIGNNIDLSQKEYIEFLVKVDSLDTRSHQVKFHLDLGEVSERFFPAPPGWENIPITEDGAHSGVRNNRLDAGDDMGLHAVVFGRQSVDPFDVFSNVEINGEFPFMYKHKDYHSVINICLPRPTHGKPCVYV